MGNKEQKTDEVRSFEFKKGIMLYYKYNTVGNIMVLYDNKWQGLKAFINKEYTALKTYKDKQKTKGNNKK